MVDRRPTYAKKNDLDPSQIEAIAEFQDGDIVPVSLGGTGGATQGAAQAALGLDAGGIKTLYESNSDTNAYTDDEKTKLAGVAAGAQVNTVNSVFGRTGAVTAQSGDYEASEVSVSPVGGISAIDVQSAIAELDSEKAPSSHTHTAADITNVPAGNISATDVQAAINELDAEKATALHGHTADAISFSPAGNISATDVQSAIEELDSEKSGTGHSHSSFAGSGTTGFVPDPTSETGRYLKDDGTWDTPAGGGGGSGDVVGPAGATNNAVARFDTATGKLIQSSSVIVDDSGNISTSGTVDGRDLSVDGAKLDLIEAQATADQTGAEIKALYEAETDTNAFTDAEQSKLGLIEAQATADQTGAEIKALYEAETDTNAFTDAEQSKLGLIEAQATADQTGAEIKLLYEAEADTNAFTDAEKFKLGLIEAQATADQIASEVPFTPVGTISATNVQAAIAELEDDILLESQVDAKGDIYVGTANDAVATLSLGSNDQTLLVDTTESTGVKWVDAPAVANYDGYIEIDMGAPVAGINAAAHGGVSDVDDTTFFDCKVCLISPTIKTTAPGIVPPSTPIAVWFDANFIYYNSAVDLSLFGFTKAVGVIYYKKN